MSREIKFRTFFNGMMSKPFKFGEAVCFPDGSASVGRNFELMQFTGLHDINGVEIYEGDIVEYQHSNKRKCRVKSVVIFNTCGFTVEANQSILNNDKVLCVCKVIGNIYQNPELWSNK